jgi:hypothetical protein
MNNGLACDVLNGLCAHAHVAAPPAFPMYGLRFSLQQHQHGGEEHHNYFMNVCGLSRCRNLSHPFGGLALIAPSYSLSHFSENRAQIGTRIKPLRNNLVGPFLGRASLAGVSLEVRRRDGMVLL